MERARRQSGHPMAVAILVALAALVGAVGIGAYWANDQLLDTPTWVSTSGRMLSSQDLRHRVAEFLTEELVAETESQLGAAGETETSEAVVPELRASAPALAERLLREPSFRRVWLHANQIGHRALVRILDDEGTGRNGRVVVDLTPALRQLADQVSRKAATSFGLEGSLGSFVEPGAARIEVLESDELDRAQDAVRAVRHLPLPATLAFLVLVGLALAVGRARLGRAVGAVGLGLVATGAIALVARAVAGHRIVDELLAREADREAAEAAWRIATSTVVDLATAAIGLGLILVLFAILLGPAGRGLRAALAPLVRTPLGRLWALALAVLAFLALTVWQPIAALGTPLGVALFAAPIGGGLLLLARETIAEDF